MKTGAETVMKTGWALSNQTKIAFTTLKQRVCVGWAMSYMPKDSAKPKSDESRLGQESHVAPTANSAGAVEAEGLHRLSVCYIS
jgi:hypothetical protein